MIGATKRRRSLTAVAIPPAPQDWLYLIRVGEEGRGWAEQLVQEVPACLLARVGEALCSLRASGTAEELAVGRDLLLRVAAGLRETAPLTSAGWVLWRFFHPAWAYWQYRAGDFDGAEVSLDLAVEVICLAIEIDPFLLPLASHCGDFVAQRIRVARNRGDGAEMARRIETAREVFADRAPLCVLRDGTPITFTAVADHCAAIPGFAPEDLRCLYDTRQRRLDFEGFIARLGQAEPGRGR